MFELASFSLFLISVILGNIYKLSFFSPDVHISPLDASVIVFTLVVFVLRPARLIRQLKVSPAVTRSLVLFLAWSLITLIPAIKSYGSAAALVGFFYWLRLAFFLFLGFTLAAVFSSGQIRRLLFFSGLAATFTGAVQYLVFPDIRSLQVAEWDPHYYRVVGSLLDPGFMAIILLLFMIFLLAHPLANRFHTFLLLLITYVVFAFTYSRSGYLALLAVAGSLSLVRLSWRPLVLTVLLLVCTVILLPRSPDGEGVKLERTSSVIARLINWGHSLQIIWAHPVTGVGYNVYRYAQKQAGFLDNDKWLKSHAGAGADSSLLFITATTGLVGLGLFVYFLGSLGWSGALRYELPALVFHSFFLNSLFYPLVLFWIAGLLARSLATDSSS